MEELLQFGFSEGRVGVWNRRWYLSLFLDLAVVNVYLAAPLTITCSGTRGLGYTAANLIRVYLLACARRKEETK